jgi:ComF family protein
VLRGLVEFGLNLIAPPACAACAVPVGGGVAFCVACAATVERCWVGGGCREIEPDRDASWCRGWSAAFAYGGAMQRAIARFKYEGRVEVGRVLAKLLLRELPRLALRGCDVVVPVPLHPRRLVARGYNQAALLAGPIARSMRVPLEPLALARTRETAQQAFLDLRARADNVAGAFRVRDITAVAGRRVLLIDDVRTTGATLAACRRALQTSGARAVHALALAAVV